MLFDAKNHATYFQYKKKKKKKEKRKKSIKKNSETLIPTFA